MAFFNRRVDPRIPDTVEWDTQIVEGATVAEFSELPARYGIRTTQIFNPDAVACEIADDEYSPFTALTRIYTGDPTASEYYADGGSAYIFLHVDNLGKYARASIYPGGTVITAERLASDEFKGATGATGPTGATGATGATGPAGPAMDAAINAAADKASPADADRIGFTDSAASFGLKRFTFADLFTWIVAKVFALTGKTTPVDADGFLITDSAASNVGKWLSWANLKATLALTFAPAQTVLWVRDEKTSGTAPQTLSATTWNKRDLGTTKVNTISGASVALGVVTLPAGTYEASAFGGSINATTDSATHIIRIYDTTNAEVLAQGSPSYVGAGNVPVSLSIIPNSRFTLVSAADIELQHWTSANNPGGKAASSGGVEPYADLFIKKVA